MASRYEMTVRIGSNIESLQAQRQLSSASDQLGRVFERLSSGQRINRASDDSAGLSVASSLAAKSRVMRRASLNVSDAVSLISTTDSALAQVSSLLTRMTELAQQAANGTFSKVQRGTLDTEFAQLDKEIRRIAESTSFNRLTLNAGTKVIPVAQNLATFSANGTTQSNNGRFTAAFGATELRVYDNLNNSVRTFTPSNGLVTGALVLDTGDVIYQEAGSALFGDGQLRRASFATGTISQLTNEANSDSLSGFTVSADGSTIAFISSTTYTDGEGVGSASGAGANRLYVLDVATGILRTNGVTVGAGTLALSEDGSRVALRTDTIDASYDNSEVFSASVSSGGVSGFERRTNTTSVASDLFTLLGINNSGELLLLSNRNITGDNGSTRRQFFKVGAGDAVQQLTSFTSNYTFDLVKANSRLDAIYFTSASNVTGENAQGLRQLFSFEFEGEGLKQVTNFQTQTLGAAATQAISADGRFASSVRVGQLERFDVTPGEKNYNFEVGSGASGSISVNLENIRRTLSGLGSLVISSEDSARESLNTLQLNSSSVTSLRGRIGASLSRLASAASLLSTQTTEFEAAESRIRDADIAEESASLVRLTIFQQGSTAILAQANQQPSLALLLLEQREQ
jgi:flagellin